MTKTTVTITPDAKMQAQLDAMRDTITQMVEDVNSNAALVDELRAQLAERDAEIEALKRNTWQPVEQGFEQECMCSSCVNKDPDSWHWKLYVNRNEIGISDADDDGGPDYSVTLPAGYALCRSITFVPDDDYVPDEPPGFIRPPLRIVEVDVVEVRKGEPSAVFDEDAERDGITDPYMPDWSKAPEFAMYHTIDENGMGTWWSATGMKIGVSTWYGVAALSKKRRHDTTSPYDMTGLDWRNSLRARPEVQP